MMFFLIAVFFLGFSGLGFDSSPCLGRYRSVLCAKKIISLCETNLKGTFRKSCNVDVNSLRLFQHTELEHTPIKPLTSTHRAMSRDSFPTVVVAGGL